MKTGVHQSSAIDDLCGSAGAALRFCIHHARHHHAGPRYSRLADPRLAGFSTPLLTRAMASLQSSALRAVYTSPQPETKTQTFQRQLPSLPISSEPASPESVKAKSTYLSELRQLVPQLQDEINGFLTERMEEDKKAAEEQGNKQLEQEAKEEENYGEENVEEDA